MILSVVGVMSLATVNVYAQEPEVAATEQVAEEAVEAGTPKPPCKTSTRAVFRTFSALPICSPTVKP